MVADAEKTWEFTKVKAVLFDLDGTLIDSEIFTEKIMRAYLKNENLPADVFEYEAFHGVTWLQIEKTVCDSFPQLQSRDLAGVFEQEFHRRVMNESPAQILGSRQAVCDAAEHFRCAVVSSSNRATVNHVVTSLKLDDIVEVKVCAEDVTKSKPNPECFLKAAQELGLTPEECLVFEDSIAGLTAAKAAGMWTVAINHRKSDDMRQRSDQIADNSISDYSDLPPQFFYKLKQGHFNE